MRCAPRRAASPAYSAAIKQAGLRNGGTATGRRKDDVEAAAPAVAPMRAANRGDLPRMARRRQPVVDRGADPPALDRRLARAGVAGDQQQRPGRRAAIACSSARSIAVQARSRLWPWRSSDPVGLDRAGAEPPVPAAVERVAGRGLAAGGGRSAAAAARGAWPSGRGCADRAAGSSARSASTARATAAGSSPRPAPTARLRQG